MVRSGFEVHDKGSRENLVTSSDLAVQDFLTERLSALLPGSGFLCEEEDLNDYEGHAFVWVIDPIDGTANYARANENCAISVALLREGQAYMGVVYSPWRGECYWAVKGGGALWARSCHDIIFDIFMDCNDVRRTGSAAVELCLLAAGYADLYFELRLMPWDYAAAALILCEAGGSICSFDGAFPSLTVPSLVVAANRPESCRRILSVVHRHLKQLPYA